MRLDCYAGTCVLLEAVQVLQEMNGAVQSSANQQGA
jgi:hypothetical protein